MSVRDKLDIIIVTYNRSNFLKNTLEKLTNKDSPVKDYDITVLDNASDDTTQEIASKFCSEYPNIKYLRNRVNIGGCPNITKAFTELATKKFVWVLADNDSYDWKVWHEIENAINNDYDAVYTRSCKFSAADIFYTATLVSAVIYKTDLITGTVAENMYAYIKYLFPHLVLISNIINNNRQIYIPTEDIVYSGINPEHDSSFTRGLNINDIPLSRKNIFWSVGYFSSIELIKDKKKQAEIIDGLRHYHVSLFDLFKTIMVKNKYLFDNYTYNLQQIFRVLNFKQKLKFIFAFLVINLSFKNYQFYEIRSKRQWKEYFEIVNEQKYIDNLSKKIKNKKVLIYGAGIISEVLFENYDLSGLNIVGISDKRFERTKEENFFDIKTILPENIKKSDFDVIMYTLKLYKNAEKTIKAQGIKNQGFSLIKRSFKYKIRL